MPLDFNTPVVDEFRANNGKVGGPFEHARLILLTTTGARSGRPHTVPLGFLHDDGGQLLVIASAAGAPRNPAWYHNLRANPKVTVETGVFTFTAEAEVLGRAERDRVFARAVEADPGWGEYQSTTDRVIPVVALRPLEGGPNDAGGWGNELKLIHDSFRRELALVRKEIAESGASLGAQLRINCLLVCRGLEHHHSSEDAQLLPFLDEHNPELAPVVERLRREHEAIAALLARLGAAITDEAADPAELRERVDRLTREVEAHLDYEEEQLIPTLNAANPG